MDHSVGQLNLLHISHHNISKSLLLVTVQPRQRFMFLLLSCLPSLLQTLVSLPALADSRKC